MCFQLIIVLNTILFESIVGNMVTVGDYSQLNPDGCGQSRHSIGVGDSCFEFHKGITSPIQGAIDAELGVAPWVARVSFQISLPIGWRKVQCSGSVIGNQWILTAALCMKGAYDIEIYFDPDAPHHPNPKPFAVVEPNGVHIHPKYVDMQSQYDMALLKMNKSVNASPNHLYANNICLPERWSGTDCHFNPTPNCNPTEYGMAAGWGRPSTSQVLDVAQIGYWRLYNYRFTLSNVTADDQFKSILHMQRVGNQTLCGGDNGAPIWQYEMGRAVIVGSFTKFRQEIANQDCEPDPVPGWNNSKANFVDQEIDWIQKVTGLN